MAHRVMAYLFYNFRPFSLGIFSRDACMHGSHGRSILSLSIKVEALFNCVSNHMCRELRLHTKGQSSILERCTQLIFDRLLLWESQQRQSLGM